MCVCCDIFVIFKYLISANMALSLYAPLNLVEYSIFFWIRNSYISKKYPINTNLDYNNKQYPQLDFNIILKVVNEF